MTDEGRFQVVGLGQCSWDILGRVRRYPAVDQKSEMLETAEQGGGPVATALVALSRLGVPSAFFGTAGGDRYGADIRAGLEKEGVDCSGLQLDPEGTSQFAFIAVEEGTAHRNIFWTRGRKRPFSFSPGAEETIRRAAVLHLDGLEVEPALAAARFARTHGVTTVLDGGTFRPGMADLLSLIDHPVVSERFAREFSGEQNPRRALRPLLEFGGTAATVTVGAGGSCSMSRTGEEFHQPAFRMEAVDTTGCGDVFHGGYIFGLLHGWTLRRTVRFAAACAALKTRALGGRAGIPGLPEVEDFLSETNDI